MINCIASNQSDIVVISIKHLLILMSHNIRDTLLAFLTQLNLFQGIEKYKTLCCSGHLGRRLE